MSAAKGKTMTEIFCIIAFDSTHSAMACEKHLQAEGFNARIIPVPVQVTANCGLAVRFEEKDLKKIKPLCERFYPVYFYRVRKEGLKKTVEELPSSSELST